MEEIVRFWNRLIQQFQYWNAVATFIPHFRFWLVTSSLRSLNLPLSQFLVLDFNFNRYSFLLVANKKSSTCCSEWSKMVFSFWDTLLWAWILKYFTGLILVCFRHPLLPPYTFFSSALQFYQNIIVHYLSSRYLQKHHTV
jgi:hypothetical protein